MCFRRTANWEEPGGDNVMGWVGEGVGLTPLSVEEM